MYYLSIKEDPDPYSTWISCMAGDISTYSKSRDALRLGMDVEATPGHASMTPASSLEGKYIVTWNAPSSYIYLLLPISTRLLPDFRIASCHQNGRCYPSHPSECLSSSRTCVPCVFILYILVLSCIVSRTF